MDEAEWLTRKKRIDTKLRSLSPQWKILRDASRLARAFAGKLVPKDPADEPAEKLLERI